MANSKKILLSFDVEEFDLPLENGQAIDLATQLSIGNKGTEAIIPLLNKHNIATTLFTTAQYAIHFPEQIRTLAGKHEIASHTYYHSSFENKHLLESRLKLEDISGTMVTGLRMPRMRKVEMEEVKKAGYLYDSSINPTWLPGRYNNLHLPRCAYKEEGVMRLPASVSPLIRIPLFWLAFKNLPYGVFKALALQTLQKDGYLCLYFHPWEFVEDIRQFSLPSYVVRNAGSTLLHKLDKLITELKQYGDFVTIQSFLA
ncbi:MAG: polysaccharide deacetylase family protein [Bacteroidota bacterium]|nr:polysaccharide deacetylase family protein [Bacteroidota bacterium]